MVDTERERKSRHNNNGNKQMLKLNEWMDVKMNEYLLYLRFGFAIYFKLVPQPDEDVFIVSVCVWWL